MANISTLRPPKHGEVRNPKGNNQYTGRNEAYKIAVKLLGSDFTEADEKHLKSAIKLLQRLVATSTKKSIKKMAKNENLTVFARALIEKYTSRNGYEQMIKDFGMEKDSSLSINMEGVNNVTFRVVRHESKGE